MYRESHTLRELFYQFVGQTSPSPLALEIQRSEGVFLYESNGRDIIDLISGVSVSNIGHSNKEVIKAVKEQVENYMHLMVYGEFVETPQVLHAKLLSSILPPSLNNVFYLNSGSEANELALKLAKRITGRREIISFYGAYHGSTQGSLSVIGGEEWKNPFRPLLPQTRLIRFNNLEDLEYITEKTACVIVEPVQAEAGVILPKNNYLSHLKKRCDEYGALLIFDEIQTGFGRIGEMFAFKKYGVIPDILTLAKALGGGMPLGAVVASQELMKSLQYDPPLGHITTFGGHPVSCAAALASLRILLRESWVSEVEYKGLIFEESISKHAAVKEVRRAGLLLAVELNKRSSAEEFTQLLLQEGALTDWFLFDNNSFRISPPLSISNDEVELSIERLKKALDKIISI